jgi:phosphoglycerate dehydrogenase-like enzyme
MSAAGGLLVASQLGTALDEAIAARVPDLNLVPIPRGIPSVVPPAAIALFATPIHGLQRDSVARPSGWPHSLRWVQLISAGADGYPTWLFDGPVVTCARGPSASPIAEYVIAAIFAGAKRFPDLWIHRREDWRQKNLARVAGSTLGIVGFGAIGQAIAQKAVALDMRVLTLRRTDAPVTLPGVERARDLADILSRSDHLVLAVPSTSLTRGLINQATLEHAKPGLHLINIARGALVQTDAIIPALQQGILSRATLDTTDPEPLPADHPLYTHHSVFLTPHSSMSTPDVIATLADKLADNLNRFRTGSALRDIVDPAHGY